MNNISNEGSGATKITISSQAKLTRTVQLRKVIQSVSKSYSKSYLK